MMGNVYEWCQDAGAARKTMNRIVYDDKERLATIKESLPRFLRGSSIFGRPPTSLRSAARSSYAPSMRGTDGGFRLARTYH